MHDETSNTAAAPAATPEAAPLTGRSHTHYWLGTLTVNPWRTLTIDGRTKIRCVRPDDHELILRGFTALMTSPLVGKMLNGFHLTPDGVEIVYAVPKLSTDFEADARRVEGFVNNVFNGLPATL